MIATHSKQTTDEPDPVLSDDLDKGIALHLQSRYRDAYLCFKVSADRLEPLGIFLLAMSLREGFGCQPDQKLAFVIFQKCLQVVLATIKKLIAENALAVIQYAANSNGANRDIVQDLMEHKPMENGRNRYLRFKPLPQTPDSHPASDSDERARSEDRVLELKYLLNHMLPLVLTEIGMCILQGWGTKQSTKLALRYLKISAAFRDEIAIKTIANVYADGTGVKRDKNLASAYYRLIRDPHHCFADSWIWKPKYDGIVPDIEPVTSTTLAMLEYPLSLVKHKLFSSKWLKDLFHVHTKTPDESKANLL